MEDQSQNMITVDCNDIKTKMEDLLVYVSDSVPAMPTLKKNGFVLSPINDEMLDRNKVISSINDYLKSIGQSTNFVVVPKEDVLVIRSIYGKKLEGKAEPFSKGFFTCPHCGFSTRFEGELYTHQKIHYL